MYVCMFINMQQSDATVGCNRVWGRARVCCNSLMQQSVGKSDATEFSSFFYVFLCLSLSFFGSYTTECASVGECESVRERERIVGFLDCIGGSLDCDMVGSLDCDAVGSLGCIEDIVIK